MKTVLLTKGEAYILFTAVMGISARNKKDFFLTGQYDLTVKLLKVKKALQVEMDALEEAKIMVADLFKDTELVSFELPTFTEEDCKIIISGPDELEAFEKLVS